VASAGRAERGRKERPDILPDKLADVFGVRPAWN